VKLIYNQAKNYFD